MGNQIILVGSHVIPSTCSRNCTINNYDQLLIDWFWEEYTVAAKKLSELVFEMSNLPFWNESIFICTKYKNTKIEDINLCIQNKKEHNKPPKNFQIFNNFNETKYGFSQAFLHFLSSLFQ